MITGFAIGFMFGSAAVFFLMKGKKRKYHSTIDDVDAGLKKLKGMLEDIQRES